MTTGGSGREIYTNSQSSFSASWAAGGSSPQDSGPQGDGQGPGLSQPGWGAWARRLHLNQLLLPADLASMVFGNPGDLQSSGKTGQREREVCVRAEFPPTSHQGPVCGVRCCPQHLHQSWVISSRPGPLFPFQLPADAPGRAADDRPWEGCRWPSAWAPSPAWWPQQSSRPPAFASPLTNTFVCACLSGEPRPVPTVPLSGGATAQARSPRAKGLHPEGSGR